MVSVSASVHRRSQEGPKGPCPPKYFENIVVLCFEMRFSKQNSVIQLKSNILGPQNFWPGYATASVLARVRLSAGSYQDLVN